MPPQRRTILPITILLGIVTAATLVSTVATVAQPPIDAPRDNSAEAAVRSFYAAVNDAIREGDSAALDPVTAPEIKVSGTTAAIKNRDDLASHIKSLRAAYPALAIEVNDVIADRHRVAAWITITGAARFGPLIAPTYQPAGIARADVLHLENGVIVEYHGLIADLNPPRQVLHETVTTGDLTGTAVGVARLTLTPEALLGGLVTLGPTIYNVMSGELAVQVNGRSAVRRAPATDATPPVEQIVPGTMTELGMGDQIEIGADVDYSLRATGREPAVAIAATWMPPGLLEPPPSENASVTPVPLLSFMMFYADTPRERTELWPSGVDNQPLLSLVTLSSPSSTISLSLWQTTFAPGATMSGRAPDGETRLLVNSGRAVIETHTPHSADNMTAVTAGTSIPLSPQTLTTVRNVDDAPLELYILVVTPTNEPPTLAVPPATSRRAPPRRE